jgi:thiol-disulfide isomerase/thioredoxin
MATAVIDTTARAGEISSLADPTPVELVLPDLEGRSVDLAELRGKVVLLNFWASWCTPCLDEMPSIQRLTSAMNGRPFAAFAVNLGEGERRIEAMVERLGIDIPVLVDTDGAVFEHWQGTVLPTTFLLDATGLRRFVGRGPLDWDGAEATKLVEQLLQEGAQDGPDAFPRPPETRRL